MPKPRSRNNGLCSSLTTISQTRTCCDCLDPTYDLTTSIKVASEIFYRLTGRQSQYAGTCTHVVRPCWNRSEPCGGQSFDGVYGGMYPHGYCGQCSTCKTPKCDCDIDSVILPGVCEIERVTIDGLVVDPRNYSISGDKLVRLCGMKWPLRQNMGSDSSPINQFEQLPNSSTFTQITATRKQDGCFDLIFSGPVVLPVSDAIEFTGDDGWKWVFPTTSLTQINPTHYVYCPNMVHTTFVDVLTALDGFMVETFKPKPTQAWNTVFSLENVTVITRKYFVKPVVSCPPEDSNCSCSSVNKTFEIVYRTGCGTPTEVQEAVGALACELALAKCGSDKCRLPSKFRSMKLDGDLVTQDDIYKYIVNGMTGLPEVDQIIKSINPHGLMRRARLLSSPPVGRYNRRIR